MADASTEVAKPLAPEDIQHIIESLTTFIKKNVFEKFFSQDILDKYFERYLDNISQSVTINNAFYKQFLDAITAPFANTTTAFKTRMTAHLVDNKALFMVFKQILGNIEQQHSTFVKRFQKVVELKMEPDELKDFDFEVDGNDNDTNDNDTNDNDTNDNDANDNDTNDNDAKTISEISEDDDSDLNTIHEFDEKDTKGGGITDFAKLAQGVEGAELGKLGNLANMAGAEGNPMGALGGLVTAAQGGPKTTKSLTMATIKDVVDRLLQMDTPDNFYMDLFQAYLERVLKQGAIQQNLVKIVDKKLMKFADDLFNDDEKDAFHFASAGELSVFIVYSFLKNDKAFVNILNNTATSLTTDFTNEDIKEQLNKNLEKMFKDKDAAIAAAALAAAEIEQAEREAAAAARAAAEAKNYVNSNTNQKKGEDENKEGEGDKGDKKGEGDKEGEGDKDDKEGEGYKEGVEEGEGDKGDKEGEGDKDEKMVK
jgi:hypothetical protein